MVAGVSNALLLTEDISFSAENIIQQATCRNLIFIG